MRMPDVNILIYAHRRDDPSHGFYRRWLEDLVNGPEPFALSMLSATAFVRIVTHPAFRPIPTPLIQALSVVEALCAAANCRLLAAGDRHWDLFRRLCVASRAAGKKVADAQHAALAMEHGCTWVTRDPDFYDFEPAGLRLEVLKPES